MIMFWLSDGSPQTFYHDMCKHILVVLMKPSWRNQVLYVSFSEGTCVRFPLGNK